MTISTNFPRLFSQALLAGAVLFSLSANAQQAAADYQHATRYNTAGQVTGTISPDPDGNGPLEYSATRKAYDSQGRLLRTETGVLHTWADETVDPQDWEFTVLSSVHYEYDEYGRKSVKTTRDENGQRVRVVQFNYDSQSRVRCEAVRMEPDAALPGDACTPLSGPNGDDRITRYQYNYLDQVTVEWRAWGTSLEQKYAEYTYDKMRMTSVTDANGNKTEMRYDDYGRLIRQVYPSQSQRGAVNENDYVQYKYDKNGNKDWERKRNGATFGYTHDALDRVTRKHVPNGRDVYYGYDLQDLKLYARFDGHNGPGITNKYDGFGRLDRVTNTMDGSSRTLEYDYDKHGNRTRITHPDNVSFSYGFDGLDRMTGVGEGTSTGNLLTVDYHANGNPDWVSRNGGAPTDYRYDSAQRVDEIDHNFNGDSVDLVTAFDYNPAGQIIGLTQSNDLYHYFGNQNQTGSYTVNGLNQYTSVDGQTYGYDDNGNLTSDGDYNYNYDDENRLTGVSGDANATLVYDPLGRLFEVTINGETRQFLYDGDALVAEYAGSTSNEPLVRYVHGDQVDQPLVQYSGEDTGPSRRRYLHKDHQGSIIAHSDYQGNVHHTLSYDSYGVPGIENVGRFGYTGQIWLRGLGLYHYKARMYSPRLGRFLQTDPIGYEDQTNLYAYVGNDPMNFTDPTGMEGEGPCAGSTADICIPFVQYSSNENSHEKVKGSDEVSDTTCPAGCEFEPTNDEYLTESPTGDRRKIITDDRSGEVRLPAPQTAEDGIPAPSVSTRKSKNPVKPGIKLKKYEYDNGGAGKIEERIERFQTGNCRCFDQDGSVQTFPGARRNFDDTWRPVGYFYELNF